VTRWYVIHPGGMAGPFVIDETPDEDVAREQARSWTAAVVALSLEAAVARDEYRPALEAWFDGDDTRYLAWAVEEEAERALYDAARDAEFRKLPPEATTADILAAIRRAQRGG